MKILGISKVVDKGTQQESAIDLWRIKRPLEELKKHTDWQIDFQPHVIPDFDEVVKEYAEDPDRFIKEKGADIVKHIGQYDVVFTSYFTSPHVYTVLWAAAKEYGTEFIFDIDDDLFDVDPGNPFWLAAGWQGAEFLRIMGRITKYISTTNDDLAEKFRNYSTVDAKVFVLPNFINDSYKEYDPQNEDIVIGWFGGASHYDDLHHSGLIPALERLMHEHKNVRFHCAGQPIDFYLPRQRVKEINIAQGTDWPTKLWPTLGYDIALGPILETKFNKHKSNIKWQESTRMGAAFIGSNVGPYRNLPDDVCMKVPNSQDAWYIALKELVENEQKRKTLVTNARKELTKWRLEDNWKRYKDMFEAVNRAKQG